MTPNIGSRGSARLLALALVAGALGASCGYWNNPHAGQGQQVQASASVCGDQRCGGDEACDSCPQDCGQCPADEASCGDGACQATEDCSLCPTDCGRCDGGSVVQTSCGNGVCDAQETCTTCRADCKPCTTASQCGDGQCNGTETCDTCAQDCGGACPPACSPNGFWVQDLAVRDSASGQYLMGIKFGTFFFGGTATVSGIRMADGTIVNNHVVENDKFVLLPGRPACTFPPGSTGACECNFPVVVASGSDRCTLPAITNCIMCGASRPEDHDSFVFCTRSPSADGGL